MIRRLAGAVALLAATVAQVVVLLLVPSTAPASAASPATDSSDTIQRFGSCLAAGLTGDLLIVLDTSASLRETDPDYQRVTAANYMVDQLAQYVSDAGSIKLNVAVAGFADSFEPSLDWTALSSGTVGTVTDAIEEYRDRDRGFETDYWAAATGARKYLDAQDKDAQDCQAWVWFSDGRYDLDKRDTASEKKQYGTTKPYGPEVELTSDTAVEQVQRAGEKDLCRAGGVADSLRFQGVTTLAVGLGDSGFEFMDGLATGAGGCGEQPAEHLGEFVLARNIDDLLFAFDTFADPQTPPVSTQTPLCHASVCPAGAHVFFLDDTISQVRILAGASIDDYYAVLVDPKGTEYTIRPGQPIPSTKGVQLSGDWESDRTFELNMGKSGPNWSGRWQMVFLTDADPGNAVANTNLRLYGDVHAVWAEKTEEVTAGETVPVTVDLQDGEGTPVNNLLGTAVLSAELVPESGEAAQLPSLDQGQIGTPQQLDLSEVSPGPAKLVLTLEVTTKGDPGTELQPDVVEYPLTVLSPPNYPTLPHEVSFGAGEVTEPAALDMAFEGAGCVWLASSDAQSLPDGVSTASVTSSTSQEAPAGTGTVPLNLSVDATGTGLVGGELKFATMAEGCSGQVVEVTVPYTYEMTRPRNETVFWSLFAVILVGGVLIPVAMLYLLKWRTAQVPGMSLTVAEIRGRVSAEENFLGTVALRRQDTRVVPLEGNNRRRIVLTSRVSMATKVGIGLTEPGYVAVEPEPVVTSTGSRKLPLAVQDRWIAALDPQNPHHGDVEIVLVLSAEATKLPEVLDDAKTRAPELIARLRSALGDPPPLATVGGGSGDDWGGRPPGAGGSTGLSTNPWGGPAPGGPAPGGPAPGGPAPGGPASGGPASGGPDPSGSTRPSGYDQW
ncbi:vWA domain-containing protein [Nocardioides sp. URHA0032]|uniref:vWA domain-containing protein n=1 Tax=Nocardioides sp. URHA0032 TaxID=1380388 RepID=UPI0009DCBBF2|nr:VWA domain-containing protein [Nocardioides sp. URHA0032]